MCFRCGRAVLETAASAVVERAIGNMVARPRTAPLAGLDAVVPLFSDG